MRRHAAPDHGARLYRHHHRVHILFSPLAFYSVPPDFRIGFVTTSTGGGYDARRYTSHEEPP